MPAPRRYGLGGQDNPVFDRMHEASALVTGGSVAAARRGSPRRGDARRQPGGRTAPRDAATKASGFCVYNDAAVAIAWLLAARACDGSPTSTSTFITATACEAAFYDDPRVLTDQPARERPRRFPRHRLPARETGAGGAEAPRSTSRCRRAPTTPAGCAPSRRRARRSSGLSSRRCWSPSWAVTPIALDPLAHLTLHRRRASGRLCEPARARPRDVRRPLAGVGGGGYALVEVVPRSWTHLLAEIGGAPLDPATATPELA